MIKEGKYRATAIQNEDGSYVQIGKSSKKETMQAVVNFRITSEGESKGRERAYVGFLTEKTLDNTIKALRACGAKGDDLSEWVSQPLTNEVELVIEHEPDQDGKPRERIKWVNVPGGGGGLKMEKPLSKDDLRLFAAGIRGKAATIAEVGPPVTNGVKPSGLDL